MKIGIVGNLKKLMCTKAELDQDLAVADLCTNLLVEGTTNAPTTPARAGCIDQKSLFGRPRFQGKMV